MNFLMTDSRWLVTETCCVCAVDFAMPMGLRDARKRDRESFYCPNGHPQSYRESELDRVKRELAEAQTAVGARQLALDASREEVRRLGRSIIGLRGRIAQIIKRRRGR